MSSGASIESYDAVVVTSAVLPWRTGPAFLSLWYACGLAAQGFRVAYGIPWLGPDSQRRLWGEVRFADLEAQTRWLADEAHRIGAPPLPAVFGYPAIYSHLLRSIVPLRAVPSCLPPARILVMAEPEHLCWHPLTPSRRRMPKVNKVVGVVMTNYPYFVARSGWPGAALAARLVGRWHRHLVKRHTDRVLLISPAVALEGLAHPVAEARVTGVLAPYFQVPPVQPETRGAYFLGRLVWDKGFAQLIEFSRRSGIPVDVFGDGPDGDAIAAKAREAGAALRFLGHCASPWERLEDYRVFINPSISEVLCTATADALVAGRYVVLPDCPGNRPFLAYPNALGYRTEEEGLQALQQAMTQAPRSPEAIRHDFDWMQACRNLAAACDLHAPGDGGV